MKKLLLFCLALVIFCSSTLAQEKKYYEKFGNIIKFELSTSMFPQEKRLDGHVYKEKKKSFKDHYDDSTALVFIPSYFKAGKKIDYVVHFHGWWNNVDSVVAQFNLIEQFYKSKKNAIFIIPQGPKNSPDSFGGRLEDKNGFKKFMSELTDSLKTKKIIPPGNIGNIILSGHSGAFRVISYILQRGGITNQIKEVFLFDALYSQTEKYAYWVDHYKGRLINIYTDDGGTKDETERFIEDLNDWGFKLVSKEEKDLNDDDLIKNRLIFIHTGLSHNQTLYKNDNFYNYLKTSCLK
jgi:hypothetical protein